MDKFIVRASAILLNIDIMVATIIAWDGCLLGNLDFIVSPNVLYGVLLSVLSHTQGRYHFKWMRALCYNSVAIPMLNYLDGEYLIFEQADDYLYLVTGMCIATIVATIYLAINHFIKVRRLKKYGTRLRKQR